MVTKKRPHVLNTNKSTARPTRHLFVDIETNQIPLNDTRTEHTLKMGYCCYWRIRKGRKDTVNYHFFTDIANFWHIVKSYTQKRNPLIIIIHNVAFDYEILQGDKHLLDMGWSLKSIYSKGHTTILKWGIKKTYIYDILDEEDNVIGEEERVYYEHPIKILDNGNFFPGALSNLGAAIGFPKLEVDFRSVSWAELKVYCKRDVEIMQKAWETYYTFLDSHNLGKWGHTIPSQAFNAFRHRFMGQTIWIHTQTEATKLERKSYHGGRCSVFYVGKLNTDRYYKLDINSAYSYAMAQGFYPIRLVGIVRNPTIDQTRKLLRQYCLVAHVIVNTDKPVYPVTHKGRNVYPVGTFETYLTTPEIVHALKHGYLVKVLTVACYWRAKIFDAYVNYFYPLKAKYNHKNQWSFYYMVKLYLNALYGKFGQRAKRFAIIDDPFILRTRPDSIIHVATGKVTPLYWFGGHCWEEIDEGEAYHSFPAIAAHVTANVRLYLWKLIQQAGKKNAYYCDTDSIVVNQAGYDNLAAYVDDTKLGFLKVEQVSDNVAIFVPKYYRVGDKWKRKGVPKGAKEIEPHTFECTRFPGLRTRSRQPLETPYYTERFTKQMTLILHDGTVDKTGWVKPFNALDLELSEHIDPDLCREIAKAEIELEELREIKIVPHSVIFQLWDYRKGTWKRARDKWGNLVPLEYSKWDDLSTELGFHDIDELQKGIREQLRINERIGTLRLRIGKLMRERVKENEALHEMPF